MLRVETGQEVQYRIAVHCVQCTVHCAQCIVHCTLCTVHSALCTVHCALCSVHCAQCTVHCALCTVHCAQCIVHCALCTVHCVQCTVHSAQCTVLLQSSMLTVVLTVAYNAPWCKRSTKEIRTKKGPQIEPYRLCYSSNGSLLMTQIHFKSNKPYLK